MEKIAAAYQAGLRAYLAPDHIKQIADGNAWPGDFCDDNVIMESAFVATGTPLWNETDGSMLDSAVDLWNAAYRHALKGL